MRVLLLSFSFSLAFSFAAAFSSIEVSTVSSPPVVVVVVVVAPDTVVTTSTSGVFKDALVSLSTLDIFSSTASLDGKETSAGNLTGTN